MNRRSALKLLNGALGAVVCGTAASAQQPAPAPAASPIASPADIWRQFRGTPALTGVSAATPPATLKTLWTFRAGEVVESSAAIVDGVVYVGGGDGELFALDLATGKQRWKYS
ncbi:MAG TPA: PQQ-binding-like beta-propeller repeat protein, partial [Vicinamibacterales bacterium]|nr:PQQ-binding-like beta-propeller repeat protein [Vicinamibacterales bacterium]